MCLARPCRSWSGLLARYPRFSLFYSKLVRCYRTVCRFWRNFWRFFAYNSVPLVLILAAVWLVVLWVWFREFEQFAAYATFGTALVTLALAFATVYMAMQNRELVKQNRIMLQANRIKEIILSAINPLLKSMQEISGYHEKREYMWVRQNLQTARKIVGDEQALMFQIGAEDAFLPHPRIIIEETARTLHQLNEAVYREFRKMQSSLTERIQEYDNKAEGFRHLLLDLAKEILSPEFREKVELWLGLESESALQKLTLSQACLNFNKLLGASEEFTREQVRDEKHRDFWRKYEDFVMEDLISRDTRDKVEQIMKEAYSFVAELKGIEAELSQIKDIYLKDYHLTREETEATNKGPAVPHAF